MFGHGLSFIFYGESLALSLIKARGSYLVTLSNWTPICDCNMAMLVVMNKHQKDTCYDEIHNILQSSEYVWRGSVHEEGDSQIDGTLFLTPYIFGQNMKFSNQGLRQVLGSIWKQGKICVNHNSINTIHVQWFAKVLG